MPSSTQGRGSFRTLFVLLALLLCLSPLHSATATAAIYRVRIPIVTGPSIAPPPTSFELIDAAVTAGTLSFETGLLFKVYNTFGDPRLPGQYRGDDSRLSDSHALTYALQRWDTLTPSTREALRPFLTPPVYSGSWYDQRTGSPASAPPVGAAALEPYPICGAVNRDKWTYDTGRVAYVKIWWPKGQLATADIARAFLNEMDSKIWPKLTGLMGTPLVDGGTTCGGDDDRLDIYLAPVGRSFEMSLSPPGCKATPGYIVLDPSRSADILAHEFMHAIQDRFATANSCVYASDYAWLCEATAVWAQHYVYPTTNREHYLADYFLNNPRIKLDEKNDAHEYGAYLFPFYIAGTQGAPVIRTMWDNTTSNSGLDAVDKAVQGGFSEVWPRFITYNWNRAPYDFYKQWDGLPYSAKEETVDVSLGGAALKEFDAGPPRLIALSSSYYHFKFTDPKVRSVAFYNGLSFKVVKRDAGYGLGNAYFADAADPEQVKGASVTALIKIDGTWRKEDWTKKGVAAFCLDKKDERLQELVLVFGNSAHKPAGNVLTPPGERPKLVASYIGCFKWEGSVDMTQSDAADGCASYIWRMTVPNLLWERLNPTSTGPSFAYTLKQGTLNWSITDGECGCGHTHGSGSLSLVPIHGAAALVSGNFILDGGLYRRMSANAADTTMINWTECDNPRTTPLPFNWGVISPSGPTLTADGTLDGSYDLGLEGSPVWTWHLTPKAE